MEMVHGRAAIADRIVMHRCDNPACFRFDHLAIGTRADNNADRDRKRRAAVGSAKPDAKLNDDAVRKIRHLIAAGVTQTEIAAAYGVAGQQVSAIKLGKRWGHVHGPGVPIA